jgi:CBS domain-containing protein
MNVEAILKTKGRTVHTIAPDAKVGDAIANLGSKGIGALVVSRDGETVVGILSERDIVRALADRGTGAIELAVSALMSRNVHSCTPDDSIAMLMAQMTERRIRHLPVIEDGRLAGLVSIGDVVKIRLDEVEFEATSLREFIASA